MDRDLVLLERFAATANPSSDLLASVKPLLVTERWRQMLRSIRERSANVAPRFTHLGGPDYAVTSIPIAPVPRRPARIPISRTTTIPPD
ncbi:MAG: hypothetical protein WEA80_01090 [Gemmatimonadaceae bacterium]